MARCEDWPCCGHEAGCCPDYDESGKQLNMKCTCGATVPLGSRYSICQSCMNQGYGEPGDGEYDFECDEFNCVGPRGCYNEQCMCPCHEGSEPELIEDQHLDGMYEE